MKETPIIFTAKSVRAILEGRKTQTRRVIVPQPHKVSASEFKWKDGLCDQAWIELHSPYGVPGDRLWVKEGWRCGVPPGMVEYKDSSRLMSRTTENVVIPTAWLATWRSPMYMPRWASRLTLEITEIRVQRVQEISADDAWEEGCWPNGTVDSYHELWDSINSKRGYLWESNPWVWVVSHKRQHE